MVGFNEATSRRALTELQSLPGVEYGEPVRTIPARLRFGHRTHRVYIWAFEPDHKKLAKPQTVSTSDASIALSKDLKKRGWKFVGPTTVYAFMQAMGLVNDHVEGCTIRKKVETARKKYRRPG